MKKLNLEELFALVCATAGFIPEAVKISRKREYINCKAVCCYIAREHLRELSFQKVAQVCGLTNHSTVIHHVNTTKGLPENDSRKILLRNVEMLLDLPQYIYVILDTRDGAYAPVVAYFDEQKAKDNLKKGFIMQQVRIV